MAKDLDDAALREAATNLTRRIERGEQGYLELWAWTMAIRNVAHARGKAEGRREGLEEAAKRSETMLDPCGGIVAAKIRALVAEPGGGK